MLRLSEQRRSSPGFELLRDFSSSVAELLRASRSAPCSRSVLGYAAREVALDRFEPRLRLRPGLRKPSLAAFGQLFDPGLPRGVPPSIASPRPPAICRAPSSAVPEPSPSRPAPSAALAKPVRICETPFAARFSPGRGGSVRRAGRPSVAGPQFVAGFRSGRGFRRHLLRADHRLHGRVFGDLVLPLGRARRAGAVR